MRTGQRSRAPGRLLEQPEHEADLAGSGESLGSLPIVASRPFGFAGGQGDGWQGYVDNYDVLDPRPYGIQAVGVPPLDDP